MSSVRYGWLLQKTSLQKAEWGGHGHYVQGRRVTLTSVSLNSYVFMA